MMTVSQTLTKSQKGSTPSLCILYRVQLATSNGRSSIIRNGRLDPFYNSTYCLINDLQLTQIPSVEIYSGYKLEMDSRLSLVQISHSTLSQKKEGNLTIRLDSTRSSQIVIEYICQSENRYVVRFTIELEYAVEAIGTKRMQKYFEVIKICGNMGLFSFKVGLNTFKLSRSATTEIMLNGKMQSSFVNSKLQNISIDNNFDVYFWSYNCDYKKYSTIFNTIKKEIQLNPQYWFLQTLNIKDWYFEVEDINIIQPELTVDDVKLNLDYYDYQKRQIHNLKRMDKNIYNYQTKEYLRESTASAFIQIDEENEYLKDGLVDNVKESQEVWEKSRNEDNRRVKQKIEDLSHYQWDAYNSSKSMLTVQNSLLKRLIALLDGYIIQLDTSKQNLQMREQTFIDQL